MAVGSLLQTYLSRFGVSVEGMSGDTIGFAAALDAVARVDPAIAKAVLEELAISDTIPLNFRSRNASTSSRARPWRARPDLHPSKTRRPTVPGGDFCRCVAWMIRSFPRESMISHCTKEENGFRQRVFVGMPPTRLPRPWWKSSWVKALPGNSDEIATLPRCPALRMPIDWRSATPLRSISGVGWSSGSCRVPAQRLTPKCGPSEP